MPDTALDLRYLRYAMLVAEQGSFRRVAAPGSLATTTSRTLGASCGVIERHSTVFSASCKAASLAAISFGLDHRGVQPCQQCAIGRDIDEGV